MCKTAVTVLSRLFEHVVTREHPKDHQPLALAPYYPTEVRIEWGGRVPVSLVP